MKRLLALPESVALPACVGDEPGPAELEFAAEEDLLRAFEVDSGDVPEAAPTGIRVVAAGRAELTARAGATAIGDELEPLPLPDPQPDFPPHFA